MGSSGCLNGLGLLTPTRNRLMHQVTVRCCAQLRHYSCNVDTFKRPSWSRFVRRVSCLRSGVLPVDGSRLLFVKRDCKSCLRSISSKSSLETGKRKGETIGDHGENKLATEGDESDMDFFGFNEIEPEAADDQNGHAGDAAPRVDSLKKYSYLFKPSSNLVPEKLYLTTYGAIRYDSDNRPAHEHDSSQNYIEDQYFPRSKESEGGKTYANAQPRDNYIDDQYFPQEHGNSPKVTTTENTSQNEDVKVASSLKTVDKLYKEYYDEHRSIVNETEKPVNYIEESYFGNTSETAPQMGEPAESEIERAKELYEKYYGITTKRQIEQDSASDEEESSETTYLQKDAKPSVKAYDYVANLRRAKRSNSAPSEKVEDPAKYHATDDIPADKLDSKGFRILNQIKDLDREPEFTVLGILKHNILYNENDIVALNKPYGLPLQYGSGHHHYLTKFLPDLAKHVSASELYTVHRLDKETTGVLILAKTQRMASVLQSLFAEGQIVKTYWALSKGVPNPAEGIIDIPMSEITISGKARMTLKPERTSETSSLLTKKSGVNTHKAVTEFKVLASYGNAALVELKPKTGVKHQLRVHMASGLGCPVLGDHKYSHLSKLAPQTLPSDLLERLGIRQSKVRHLPMHLHARGVVIPTVLSGRDIHIGARLPRHFVENMRRLKLTKSPK